MSLPSRKTIYGVHSVSVYDPATGIPLGDIAKVVGNLTVNLTGELVQLNGGSQPFPWQVENGLISTETSLLLREYPNFVYEAFLGKAVTEGAAEANGGVGTLTNVKGTSVLDAATGIASIGVESGEGANVKSTKYVIEAVTATTVNVYALGDVDFKNGDDLSYQDSTLKVNASPITVPGSDGTVSIPNTGLEITGGSGTVAMTVGDTAFITSRAANTGYQEVIVGDASFSLPDVGIICYAQKAGDNSIYEIDIFKAKGAGAPISFAEKAFSEAEIPVQAFYDSVNDGVFRMRRIQNTN